jgi:Fe-S-cluster containining protein
LDISKLLAKYRGQCSLFCISSCDAKCCKKGKLHFFNDLDIFKGHLNKLENGCFELTLPCPLIKNNTCNNYLQRPEICADFPLFLRGKVVQISSFCPATALMTDLTKTLNDEGIKYYII